MTPLVSVTKSVYGRPNSVTVELGKLIQEMNQGTNDAALPNIYPRYNECIKLVVESDNGEQGKKYDLRGNCKLMCLCVLACKAPPNKLSNYVFST